MKFPDSLGYFIIFINSIINISIELMSEFRVPVKYSERYSFLPFHICIIQSMGYGRKNKFFKHLIIIIFRISFCC